MRKTPGAAFRPSTGLLTHARFRRRCAGRNLGRGRHASHRLTMIRCSPRSSWLALTEALPSPRCAAALEDTRDRGHRNAISSTCDSSSAPRLFAAGGLTTRALEAFSYAPRTVEVLSGGYPDHRSRIIRDGSDIGASACRPRGRWTICRSGSRTAHVGNPGECRGARDHHVRVRRSNSTRLRSSA